MKNIIFALSVVTFASIFFSCSTENKNNDWKALKLNGKIESITEHNYDAIEVDGKIKAGNRTSNSDVDCFISFNKEGFMLQKKLFNIDETVNSIYMYEYNKNNLLTKMTKYNAMESVDKVYVTEYDEKTNQKKIETTYTALGNKEFTEKFFYQKALISKQETYTGNGALYCKWEYDYDKNGNKTKANWYINNTITQISYEYNAKNELIKQEEINQDNIRTNWEYEYDDNGNVKKETCIFSDNSKGVRTYEYTYDQNKNWTQKITIDNETPLFITERTIKYS